MLIFKLLSIDGFSLKATKFPQKFSQTVIRFFSGRGKLGVGRVIEVRKGGTPDAGELIEFSADRLK